jgi:predicted nucleotidyltransferase
MRATKKDILEYLKELKLELKDDGIVSLGLFGSFASGKNSTYSDIDIAIGKQSDFLEHRSSYEYFHILEKIRSKVRSKFHRNIDLFDLDSSSELKKSIQNELIYV